MDLFESNDLLNEGKPVRVVASDLSDDPELLDCCKRTIGMHAKNNPMMVCGECKKIIKVFDNDTAYRNYQRFCTSRHRRFLATRFGDQHVVIFKNYDSYSA